MEEHKTSAKPRLGPSAARPSRILVLPLALWKLSFHIMNMRGLDRLENLGCVHCSFGIHMLRTAKTSHEGLGILSEHDRGYGGCCLALSPPKVGLQWKKIVC